MNDCHVFVFFIIVLLLLGWKHNHLQTVFLLLFGSKDTVPEHNIFHEDAQLPSNFYSGTINDDAFACGGRCFVDSSEDFDEEGSQISGMQDAFQFVVMVLVIAAFMFIVLFESKKRHRKCDMKGKTIGKLFVSSKEIAKGSNKKIVFEGRYEGRKVAVKRVVIGHHEVAFKEIQNLIASDQHPNIVRWYGYEHDLDFIYLSLERCDCNLYDLVQNKRYSESFNLWRPTYYPSAVLLKLMRDIVAGLVHLHDLRIVHRNLKPHNVLIVKGKDLCAKLSNMGISKRAVGDMSSLGTHAIGSGRSGWQAPEQLLHGCQTQAVDMFSLGCVLFFCMTRGKHPFGDPHERDVNVTKNKVSLFLVERIPEALDLCSRLLNHNPELRPKILEVLCHPLFWNSETRMSFLRDTSDWLELEAQRGDSVVLTALESKGLVICRKWNVKMESAFISSIRQHRNYNYKSVRDLLRAIRNTLNHYRKFPEEIQVSLGSMPEGFDDYFGSRFPKLLMEVYKVMHLHCKQEEWFNKYLKN
ncbi:serine/threonine-protein kinase/endoribonuclease IRE1a-like isoform X2 [Bidens hawaiensis]|uniref:serine/threonine-protein kinase/endoribonuclease IRE1a-like isoform X2 n=1 Tax=Bidens hawaiensis TaxID=980011 RepID=UPI00404A15D4